MNMKVNNEDGYMIVVVLMILSILTVIATAGTNNAITEQRSATNEQIHELSFTFILCGGHRKGICD
jgi:Tfp pilus assembly protein PilX